MTPDELQNLVQAFQTSLEALVSQPDGLVSANSPTMSFTRLTDVMTNNQTLNSAGDASDAGFGELVSVNAVQALLASITNTTTNLITSTTPLVALGIDSITAIQIAGHFRRAGMKLAVNDIIISQTVADMITKIRPFLATGPGGPQSPLKPAVGIGFQIPSTEKDAILARLGNNAKFVEHIMGASSGMKWLIGAWQRSDRSQFQHTFVYRLPANFDTGKIRQAWLLMLQRLPLLRSTFVCPKGGLEPRIVTFEPGRFEDWTEEQIDDDEILLPSVFARMKELVSSPPPTNRPPTRAVLLYSRERCYFGMHLHHFQFDAWTLPLISDDLSRLYLGLDTITTNDISSFLRAYTSNPENLEIQKEYWQSSFPRGFQPILLPALIPPTKYTDRPERVIYTTKAAITNAALCEERARSLHVSLQAVFLACWAQVQGKYSSANFTTLGLWQAGRSGPIDDIARMVSPCSNIVPMYIPGLEGTAIDLAKNIQSDLRARTAPIVQSDLVQVDAWVGAKGKPLCNVVVNIIRISPDLMSQEGHLEQVEVCYTTHLLPEVSMNQSV
jgi:aryl carrier-like protein